MKLPLVDFLTGERHRGAEGRPAVSPSDVQAILRYSAERMGSPAEAEAALRRQYPQGEVEEQLRQLQKEAAMSKDTAVAEAAGALRGAAEKSMRAVLAAADVLAEQVPEAPEPKVTTQDQIRERINQIHEKAAGQKS